MIRQALVIGHDHVAGLGHLEAVLIGAGYQLTWFTVVPAERFLTAGVTVAFPKEFGWDLIVTLGAPWPAGQISTWTGKEVEFLRSAHDRRVPVLGICFGAQLLAQALGGGSEPMGTRRLGWQDVVPDSSSGIPAGPWFHWHTDRLVPPEQAEELATNDDGVQIFRLGSSVGVQFHPEMTPALLEAWLELPGSSETVGSAGQLARLREDTLLHQAAGAAAARRLLLQLLPEPAQTSSQRGSVTGTGS